MLSLQVNSNQKLLMGSIQLPSFLGKSSTEIVDIANYAAKNAKLFSDGGFDGVFIQDVTPGDLSLDIVSNLSAITKHVKDALPHFAIGTQMECDDAKAILAVAKSAPCEMVRIKNYVGAAIKNNGLINGQGPEAYRYKIEHKINTAIFSDIFNLTGVPLGNLSLIKACGMALKLGVSGLIICGHDYEETVSMLKTVKEHFPKAFVICGGNATIDNATDILAVCDGVIVSSSLKSGTSWDIDKIKTFTKHAKKNS